MIRESKIALCRDICKKTTRVTELSQMPKQKGAIRISLEDDIHLLQGVIKHRYNWEKVRNDLQNNQHRLEDKDIQWMKRRVSYIKSNKEKYNKNYEPVPFRSPKKGKSTEEWQQEEKTHKEEQAKIGREHSLMKSLILSVTAEEVVATSTGDAQEEAEKLQNFDSQQTSLREQRRREFEAEKQEERQLRQLMIKSLQQQEEILRDLNNSNKTIIVLLEKLCESQ